MATRSTTKTRSRRGGGLRHAAALVPLAIGLGMNVARTPSQPPSTPAATATAFQPSCTLPFNGVLNPAIDNKCAMDGGSSDPAKQAESTSKNDFCASTASPDVFTYQQLLDLQTTATNAKLKKSLPDRSVLNNMGEGKYVSYVAFIKEAHYSDVSKGEAVNCNIPGNTTNDIHIVLMPNNTDTDECHSTTAEMSPHFRPDAWTPENLMAIKEHPVRIRGHLFYDGSHTPCTASSKPNPQRASLWEIHPVYSLDVCRLTDLTQCQNSTNAGDWTPLDEFLSSEGG